LEVNTKIAGKRSFARFFAYQTLFSHFLNPANNIIELIRFFEQNYITELFFDNDYDLYKKYVNTTFLDKLLLGISENIEAIDFTMGSNLADETLNQPVKCLIRMAIFEFLYTDIDKNVVISEYTDIAGEYFDSKDVSFVNAVLEKISKVEKIS